jgi:molybdopterin-binding protein
VRQQDHVVELGEAARELGLAPGTEATALVKATSVMIER